MKGTFFLLLSAFIWGFALVAQKEGMAFMGVFGFTSVRCLLGGFSMLPLLLYRRKKMVRSGAVSKKESAHLCLKGAVECGLFLTAIMLLQQIGLPYTTVGKAAFITALYIPLTPLLQTFCGKKTPLIVWLGGAVTVFGLYLLCFTGNFRGFSFGDLCMLGAALASSLQMLAVDKWVRCIDGVTLSCLQFLVVGILCLPFAIAGGELTAAAIQSSLLPLLYAGLCSCGIGYTFQVLGQKDTTPPRAAILLSTETIFSLLAGMLFYHEIFTWTEYAGCLVMFLGVLLSQYKRKKKTDL